MRVLLLGLGILALTASIGTRAEAQNYPWCADYAGGVMGGARNCGFSTYEQCAATVSGIGGFCNRNTQYVPGGVHRSTHRIYRRGRYYPYDYGQPYYRY